MNARAGVAAVGECMIELSGATADTWRMGFAGDTFNQIWAVAPLPLPLTTPIM